MVCYEHSYLKAYYPFWFCVLLLLTPLRLVVHNCFSSYRFKLLFKLRNSILHNMHVLCSRLKKSLFICLFFYRLVRISYCTMSLYFIRSITTFSFVHSPIHLHDLVVIWLFMHMYNQVLQRAFEKTLDPLSQYVINDCK